MRVVAITGGIGCGKSTVTATLAAQGVPIVDADAISRSLTAPQGKALPAIRDAFGAAVFHGDGTLDRAALAKQVFDDETSLKQLNAILHPLIDAEIRRELERLRQQGCEAALLDVPLLYEAGMEGLADTVLCVTLPERLQIERVRARDGMTEQQALARIRNQWPLAEKEKRANYVLSTEGTIEETSAKALTLWRTILTS